VTIAGVIGAITALGAVVGGLVYLFKAGLWIFSKSPEKAKEQVDQADSDLQHQIEQDGRPH
jgi:hypothetical protein